jgi:hypothetical protein
MKTGGPAQRHQIYRPGENRQFIISIRATVGEVENLAA